MTTYVSTNFGGTGGSNVEAMTPTGDIGLPWIRTGGGTGLESVYIGGATAARKTGVGGFVNYAATLSPSADCRIAFSFANPSPSAANNDDNVQVQFRRQALSGGGGSGLGGYILDYQPEYGGYLRLYAETASATVALGNAVGGVGVPFAGHIDVQGNRIRVYSGSNPTPLMDYTDTANYYPGAGTVGFGFHDSGVASTDTSGTRIVGPFTVTSIPPSMTASIATLPGGTTSTPVTLTGASTAFAAGSITISANNSPTTPPTIVSQFETGSTTTSDLLHITPGTGYTSYPSTLTLTDTTDGSIVATIQVTNPAYFAVTPANAAVAAGVTQQFGANPSTGTPSVTWSTTNGTGAGAITAGGVFTGTTPGTVTVTAAAPGYASSTVTVTVTPAIAPTAPTIALTPTAAGNVIAITTPSVAGSSPIASYVLKAGTTPGSEGGAAVATLPTTAAPLQFPPQPSAAAGASVYYTVQAADNQSTPTLSTPSNEVGQKTTSIVPGGQTSTMTVSAPYGPTATGLAATLGYIIYDATGAVVVPRTTGKTSEIPGTGIYLVAVTLNQAWSGVVVVDAPAGMGQYTQTFDAPSAAASAVTLAATDPTAQRVAKALPNAVSGAVGGLPVAQTMPNTLLMDPTQSTAGAARGTTLGGIRAAESGAIGREVETPATPGATAGPGTLTTYDVEGQVEVVKVVNDIANPTTVTPTS